MDEIRKKKENSIIIFLVGIIFAIIGYALQKGFVQIAYNVKEEAMINHPESDEALAGAFFLLIGFIVFCVFMITAIILMIIGMIKFILAFKNEKKANNKE